MENKQPVTIGVDVSKETLEVAILFTDSSFTEQQFSNDARGLKQLLAWVAKHGAQQCRICVEATGGLELDLCLAGYDAGHPITVAAPVLIARFRESLGIRGKTDRVDARIIARFVFAIPPENDWQKPSPAVQALRDALKWRRELVKCHTMLSNCANTLRDAKQKKVAATSLKHHEKQLDKINASMDTIIAQDEHLTQLHQLLCSIPGIGTQTAAALCAVLDDNTFRHPKQLAAYIGITPKHRQSGNCAAPTPISKQGNADLRTLLFMAGLSARVHNPTIRAFADQLSRRRPELSKKQIIVACAHKLTRIIHGVATHKKPFDPSCC